MQAYIELIALLTFRHSPERRKLAWFDAERHSACSGCGMAEDAVAAS